MKKIFRKKNFCFFPLGPAGAGPFPARFCGHGPQALGHAQALLHAGPTLCGHLLGNTRVSGPWGSADQYRERMGSRETWEAFKNYPAPEGYYFLDYFQEYPAMPMQSSSGATTRPTSSMFCSII